MAANGSGFEEEGKGMSDEEHKAAVERVVTQFERIRADPVASAEVEALPWRDAIARLGEESGVSQEQMADAANYYRQGLTVLHARWDAEVKAGPFDLGTQDGREAMAAENERTQAWVEAHEKLSQEFMERLGLSEERDRGTVIWALGQIVAMAAARSLRPSEQRWEILGQAGGRRYGLAVVPPVVGSPAHTAYLLMQSDDGQNFHDMHNELSDYDWPSREAALTALVDWLAEQGLILAPEGAPAAPRKSNRKVQRTALLYLAPNILNDGTRRLGALVAGSAVWEVNANQRAYIGTVEGVQVGRIVFGAEDEAEEVQRMTKRLEPRVLQSLVATSSLIHERTKGQPLNQAVTITVSELAEALHYKRDKWRRIDPDILRRIGADLRALSKIETFAADGPWDRKTKSAPSGWIAPLLMISAVHVGQAGFDGEILPFEFDAMLGRNWAEAIKERFDVVQFAPGFMELDPAREAEVIKLAWFYLTEFRYRMTAARQEREIPISRLCADADIPIDRGHLGRFLGRLESWHKRLKALDIIGGYHREPLFDPKSAELTPAGSGRAPRDILDRGSYTITPPPAIIEAYRNGRQRALATTGKATKPEASDA